MRVAVGADETGPLPDAVVAELRELGHHVDAVGPIAGEPGEWADTSARVAAMVAEGTADLGVVLCWTGTGASIAANKVPGARAALCPDADTATMARRYNHANVLALSMRSTSEPVGREIVRAFLAGRDGTDAFDVRNVAVVDALDRRDRT